MSEPVSATVEPAWKRWLSPWRITAVLLGIFFLGQAYLAWRDRPIASALESYPPFAAPSFDLRFSRNFSYDPHSFVGRGARAGFWLWTPEALVLTEEGRKYFEETGGMIVSKIPAGARRIQRIRTNRSLNGALNGERQIEFLYEWTEVSPPASVLLVPPPRLGEPYPGSAVIAREAGSWTVRSFRTRDFEEPLAHLKDIASGVLR